MEAVTATIMKGHYTSCIEGKTSFEKHINVHNFSPEMRCVSCIVKLKIK
jgi:hypothetical protein